MKEIKRRNFLGYLPALIVGVGSMAGVVQVSENMALAADVDLLGKRQNATEMAVGGVLNLAHRVTLIEGEVMVVKRGIDILARGENLIFQKLEK